MNAEQIEAKCETTMDRLDRDLIANRLTVAEYDAKVIELSQWASHQYHVARRMAFLYA